MEKRLLVNRLMGLLLSLLMLALATPGCAENRAGAVTLSPYIGGYTFDHDQSYQNLEIAPIYGMRLGYNFDQNWGVEGRFGYVLAESRGAKFQEADVYSYGIDALFNWNVTPNFVPFLAAGMGGIHHNYPASGFGYYPEYTANYGLGIKYFVADNVALRADVRHVILPDDRLQNIEYTAGVTFLIGGGEKPAVKACPADTSAPYVTLATPLDGSTDASTHPKMRVAFSKAMDPATINATTMSLNQETTPVQGTVSAPSNTTAGFTLASELAPDTRYTGRVTTGVRDLAGNAMANDYVWSFKTAPLLVTQEPAPGHFKYCVTLHGEFDIDSALIRPEYRDEIATVGNFMKKYPTTTAVIEGHTDSVGSAEHNMGLSKQRAEAVVNYLIENFGVDRSRLEARGFGMTRPVADNSTNEGRQKNRRIEAIIDCAFEMKEVTPPDRLCISLVVDFDSGRSDIKPEYRAEIAKVGDYMKRYPTTTAVIEGHTDNVGSAENNMKLSLERAQSVVDYLKQNFGIDPNRLSAKGYGDTRRIAYNSTAEGRAKNRRIDAVIDCVIKK
jgi:outer membrane beta-barrel protein